MSTDPQGAVVPGASVIARQIETNLTRETVTDQRRTIPLSVSQGGTLRRRDPLAGFTEAHAQP